MTNPVMAVDGFEVVLYKDGDIWIEVTDTFTRCDGHIIEFDKLERIYEAAKRRRDGLHPG